MAEPRRERWPHAEPFDVEDDVCRVCGYEYERSALAPSVDRTEAPHPDHLALPASPS